MGVPDKALCRTVPRWPLKLQSGVVLEIDTGAEPSTRLGWIPQAWAACRDHDLKAARTFYSSGLSSTTYSYLRQGATSAYHLTLREQESTPLCLRVGGRRS